MPRPGRLRLDQPHPGWGNRLRAGSLRVVVHPLALGSHLREHPQRRGLRAALRDRRLGRRGLLLPGGQGPLLGVGHHGAPGVGVHRARHSRLRANPEVLLLRRARRPGLHVHPAARQLEGRLHLGPQLAVGRGARHERRRLPGHARAGSRDVLQRRRFRRLQGHVPADPVPPLLQPLVELGRDALRRGPRRLRLPQEHLRDGRRADRHDDRRGDHAPALRRRRSAGTSTTPRTTATGAAKGRSGSSRTRAC